MDEISGQWSEGITNIETEEVVSKVLQLKCTKYRVLKVIVYNTTVGN